MTRGEHLQWAKDRALEFCDTDDTKGAFASMASDIRKHKELADCQELLVLGILDARDGNVEGVRRWIEGFN